MIRSEMNFPLVLISRFFVFWMMLACGAGVRIVRAEQFAGSFRIVGYLPEYRFNRLDMEHASLLTDLILFAAEPSIHGDVELGKLVNAPWEQLWNLRKQHQTRIILCLGGWEKSTHFSGVITNPQTRTRLVNSLIRMLQDYRLNGLDIDWEYPRSETEWEAYVTLLKQLRQAFEPQQWTLSITVAPWRDLPKEAWQAVDTVQLMSYDYGQQHSTLQQSQQDMQSFLDRGIPPGKLVLGLPFYGRDVLDRKAVTYSRLVDRYQPGPDVDEISGIYFNGPATIQKKTQAALAAEIGGVMIWEIGQDMLDDRSLLRSISETVKQKEPPARE